MFVATRPFMLLRVQFLVPRYTTLTAARSCLVTSPSEPKSCILVQCVKHVFHRLRKECWILCFVLYVCVYQRLDSCNISFFLSGTRSQNAVYSRSGVDMATADTCVFYNKGLRGSPEFTNVIIITNWHIVVSETVVIRNTEKCFVLQMNCLLLFPAITTPRIVKFTNSSKYFI